MSGWKVDCEKYKSTEKLFTDIWTSLVSVADTDNDGKITRYIHQDHFIDCNVILQQ